MLLLVPAHPGSPGQRAVNQLLLCCCKGLVCFCFVLFRCLLLYIAGELEHNSFC